MRGPSSRRVRDAFDPRSCHHSAAGAKGIGLPRAILGVPNTRWTDGSRPMIVCLCNALNEACIRSAINAGASTVSDVYESVTRRRAAVSAARTSAVCSGLHLLRHRPHRALKVIRQPELFHEIELTLQKIDVLFRVDENLRRDVATDVIFFGSNSVIAAAVSLRAIISRSRSLRNASSAFSPMRSLPRS